MALEILAGLCECKDIQLISSTVCVQEALETWTFKEYFFRTNGAESKKSLYNWDLALQVDWNVAKN